MSKHLVVAVSVIAACALTTAGAEATDLGATVTVVPKNGGTPRHPQGHKITAKVDIIVPDGAARPTVTGLEIWYGRGIEFHRDDVPTCSPKTLGEGGPDACPAASRVGSGTGPAIEPPDLVTPSPKLQFFNAPGGKMIAYATLQRPARVRGILSDTVVAGARGLWPYRDAWTFPSVLQVVAGIPITPETLRFSFGYTQAAKNYISSTMCPKGGWAWRVIVHVREASGDAAALMQTGRAPCRA